MNFVGLLFGVNKQLTIAGGVGKLLPVGFYLDNHSVRLMPAMRTLAQGITQGVERSLLQLHQLGIGGAH